MKLTIIYDNEIYKKDIGLKSDWGFSCLIETSDENILFDAGAKGKILLGNMQKIGIDPSNINKIVISHEHWDHNGGLKELIPLVKNVESYQLENKNTDKNLKLTIVKKPQKISKNIHTTGRLKGVPIDEQSLILTGEKGIYVLAGCSHSGVEQIFNTAKQFGDIIGLIGGLHGFDNFSVLEDLKFICPAHCTKNKKKIYEMFPKTSVKCGVGKTIEI